MKTNKDIKNRVYIVYIGLVFLGLGVFGKIVHTQFIEGKKWIEKSNHLTTQFKNIEAVRGNIYAQDGSLLATSLPIYEARMDLNCEALTDEIFYEGVDSLAIQLADLFKDKTAFNWKKSLIDARNSGNRYFLIKRNVNYNQLKALKSFKILSKGKYKGGFIYIQQNRRKKPFELLASRTIGYSREGLRPVGLEGAYNEELAGVSGKRLMQKIAGGVWMPINDDNEIEPVDGYDLYSTIDINVQDVAENALLKQLQLHNADHGCVVVMEVATGEIKAIANLSKQSNGNYAEAYNYAVGASTEPGSTFKIAAIMCALEDGLINSTDSVNTGDGSHQFYDKVMYDSKKGGYGKITIEQAIELSSNVAISKVINEAYSRNPQAFIDRLHKMSLNTPLGLEIPGEGNPYIKNASDKSWSGISLPWMSIGYELRLTPIQILTFYNAIANDGVMVKPRFAKNISKLGIVEKEFKTEIINPKISSDKTLKKARKMLEGVVKNGTATNLSNAHFSIAGKTGTVQVANDKYGYKYESKVSYQASFCGYFPANKPKYSCIVVVNAPQKNVYYGNLVAGPIFKEIADKIYASSIEIHPELKQQKYLAQSPIPVSKNGYSQDLYDLFESLNIQVILKAEPGDYVRTSTNVNKVEIAKLKVNPNTLPNLKGMNLRDAIYVLENLGVKVEFEGKGAVSSQIPKEGTNINQINKVKLLLG